MTKPRPVSERPATGPRRQLAADPVFEALAGAILRGKLAPQSALPPERELAALFNVSRLIVRQALHRLKDIGLVRVRQGGQTIALDPESSNDPRILALTMELAPERADEQDAMERQLLGGAMLLELAELRATDGDVASLERTLAAAEARGESRDFGEFETAFWTELALATKNRVFVRESRWWFALMQQQPERRDRMYGKPELRLALYRSVLAVLRRRGGAAQHYLAAIRPLLDRRRSRRHGGGHR